MCKTSCKHVAKPIIFCSICALFAVKLCCVVEAERSLSASFHPHHTIFAWVHLDAPETTFFCNSTLVSLVGGISCKLSSCSQEFKRITWKYMEARLLPQTLAWTYPNFFPGAVVIAWWPVVQEEDIAVVTGRHPDRAIRVAVSSVVKTQPSKQNTVSPINRAT